MSQKSVDAFIEGSEGQAHFCISTYSEGGVVIVIIEKAGDAKGKQSERFTMGFDAADLLEADRLESLRDYLNRSSH